MAVTLGVLADIDLRTQRLPNRIVGLLAVATVVGVCVAGVVQADLARTIQALGIGIGVVAGALVLHIVGGLGMGDVKLSFPIAVVAGWHGTRALIATGVVTALAGGVAGLILLFRRGRGHFSYGPCLALGAVAGMIVGAPS